MSEEIIKNGYKLTLSRNRTRVQTYENLVIQTTHPIKKDKPKKRKPSIPSDYAGFNYYNRMKKRKAIVSELCWNNFDPNKVCMVTLTYDTKNGEQLYTDLKKSHYEFRKFIQRVNTHYDNFQYMATFNRQKNGNWHYHMMCNFSHSVTNQEISALWGQGFTYLDRVDTTEGFKTAIEYLINNMSSAADDIKGKHGYLCSKSLESDKVLKSWHAEDFAEFEKAFDIIANEKREILYETKNHLGIKGEYFNEETGRLTEVTIPDRELNPILKNAGYESWDTIYTYLTSSADFSNEFKPLQTATPKP